MKKVLVIAVAIILVLSGVAITALYYIGDKMVNTVLDSEINALLEDPSATIQTGQGSSTTDVINAEPEVTNEQDSNNASVIGDTGNPALEVPQDSTTLKDKQKIPSVNKDNTETTDIKETADTKNSEKKIQYTVEQMNEVKDKVTAADKISSAALLVKRLTSSDIEELKNMLPGGVDAAEKKRAMEIMYQRFTDEEIKDIRNLYERYMN